MCKGRVEIRAGALICLLSSVCLCGPIGKQSSHPSFTYDVARTHEIKPHRRTVPLGGVLEGFNQLALKLVVSPEGDVIDAHADGDESTLKFWPQLQDEVNRWRFKPFHKHWRTVTAEVQEYIDLVPPERLPTTHVVAPVIRPDSTILITLERSDCYGRCPSCKVTVGTNGIVFEGRRFVVASGRHTDRADSDDVRKLAARFVAADFYSMEASYFASATDFPAYQLSIAIDGHTKTVTDYRGSWVGMPAVISDLQNEVDRFARTEQWINGSDSVR